MHIDTRDKGFMPESGRSPRGGQGHPLQYSCLEKPMDRESWRATVHGVTENQTWWKRFSMHLYEYFLTPYYMPGAGICWTLSSGFDATILQRWLRLDLEPKAEDQISFQLRHEHPHGLSAGRPPHHKPRDSEPTQGCQISLQVSLKTPHPLPIPTTSKLFPKPHLREQSLPNRTMTKTWNVLLLLYKTSFQTPSGPFTVV